MENVFLSSEPIMALLITVITVALMVIGRKLELPQLPVMIVFYSLGLLIYHTIEINKVIGNTTPLYYSVAMDLVILFLGFISYLWVDDIAAKNKGLKSYGNVLSWFWDKL